MIMLADVFKAYPHLESAERRIKALAAKNERLQAQCDAVRAEYGRLKDEHEGLKARYETARVNAPKVPEGFAAETEGRRGKRRRQSIEPLATCPSCDTPLCTFPPGADQLLVCTKCGFVARGIRPSDLGFSIEKPRSKTLKSRQH